MAHTSELESWLRRSGVSASFRALAELIPDAAVVVTDGEGRVLLWSGEAERMFGYEAADLLGQPCPGGLLCDDRGPRPFGASARLTRADGSAVQVRHYTRLFADADGPTGAIHLMVLDARSAQPPAQPPTQTTSPTVPEATEFHGLVTRDPAFQQIFAVIRNVAETDATVLIRGESGTGKELVAKAIHAESGRRDGPFIAVNCAAFTPSLLESELFGHSKGAFTGAVAARKGIFAQADGGTLFLDEVAELPLDLQAKLLRVLQERRFVPVGATDPVDVDVRLIAATHRSLREEVRAGRFREDLMFRLRVVPIFLPPLRERPLDVDLLLRHFASTFNQRGPRVITGCSPEAKKALLDYAWPGNVRELRNVIEYAFAVGRGPTIERSELPPELRGQQTPTPRAVTPPFNAGGSETDRVRAALDATGGDIDAAAALLQVSRTTFWRMRKRAGI